MCTVAAASIAACGGGGGGSTGGVAAPAAPVVQVTAQLVTSVPTPNYGAASEELIAFNYLNAERARCGFGKLAQSVPLDKAAKAHADYQLINTFLGHFENAAQYPNGFTGVEDVLAGRGIEHIHAYVTHTAGTPAHLTSAQIMAAIAARDPLALETARHYVRILGQELGNLAMIHLPYGGIFLIGGMSRAMAPMFGEMGLTAHFHDKGRMRHIVQDCAVSIVTDDFAALTGCAVYLANGGIG